MIVEAFLVDPMASFDFTVMPRSPRSDQFVLDAELAARDFMLTMLSPYANPWFLRRYKQDAYNDSVHFLERSSIAVTARNSLILRQLAGGIVESEYWWLKEQRLRTDEFAILLANYIGSVYSLIAPSDYRSI